ncbi:MAG: SUMF1/EgtB/PvdO family nonheme iron enzyme [Gemmatimonadaceae bacterium]
MSRSKHSHREHALARVPRLAIGLLIALSLAAPGVAAAQVADAEFVVIRPGSFPMGSTLGDDHQRPVRTVTLTRSFSLQKTEVTQAQWLAVMDTNPSVRQNCLKCPVDHVSYDDVQRFIARLNARSAAKYRLPTEAEWEYAARAGAGGAFGNPGAMTQGGFIADYPAGATQPVGSLPANAWGVHDMEGNANVGNIWEWVGDWYGPWAATPATDPVGPASGEVRVLRGGAFQVSAAFSGATCRLALTPSNSCVARTSFRLVRI